jgi:hypothetical protein
MKASGVTLVKFGARAYNGSVTVTVDGASFMDETKPLAFGVLVGRMFDTIFRF